MPPYESNWQTAMGGHLDYHQVANNAVDPLKEDPADKYPAPKGYKPSTPQQRSNWNQFLDYLEKKGVGGSKDLDARDKSLGKKLLDEYNKANPDKAVSEEFIPIAQHESYLIRKKGQFAGMDEKQAKYAFHNLPEKFRNKEISPVDSWLGSVTSRQYYPTFERVSSSGPKQQFGTSFEDYVKGLDTQFNATAQNQ